MPASTVSAKSRAAFKSRLKVVASEVQKLLDSLLTRDVEDGEAERPVRLLQAMRYACLTDGKRLRPFFVVETARLFGVPDGQALMAAVAAECVHSYSLVHDDLPAMDNDALRRGKPPAHKAFD